jgi:DNA-binding NtrC family response regulator
MILFIDDEKREMESFVIELKLSGFDVNFIKNVDDAWNYLTSNPEEVKLMILDIMMPAGNKFKDDDIHNGLRTGVRFFDEMRVQFPNLPIIIFTNVSDPNVVKKFEHENMCRYFSKPNLLPDQLVDEIKSFLGKQS